MVSAIGGNSSLQMIGALNAFRSNNNSYKPDTQKNADFETSNGINLPESNQLLKNIDIKDVKNYAEQIGEINLTEEDIKYGLTYGRSVIADYIA